MKPDLIPFIGKRVTVTVDRPLGSLHPDFPSSDPYPINYGYIAGTVSGDGQPVDAYVLGVTTPVESASGTVIAVVTRADDNEDKLIISAEDEITFTPDEIWARIEFQERHFKSTLYIGSLAQNLRGS
jgi:inorganic pyrophosphatase